MTLLVLIRITNLNNSDLKK